MMNSAKWTTDMYNDAVHPNEKGNQQIARLFWDAILDEVLQINDSGDNSYVEPVPDGEDGMRDKGASIYFVGAEPGEVTVTVTKHYPTCPDDEQSFVLVVAEDLSVTKKAE